MRYGQTGDWLNWLQLAQPCRHTSVPHELSAEANGQVKDNRTD